MPIPAIVGAALIGGGASLIGTGLQSYTQYKANEQERRDRRRAANELREQGELTDQEYQKIIKQIDDYYDQRGSLGTADDVTAYKKAIADFDPDALTEVDYSKIANADENGQFAYDKTKEDFLNPYYAQIIGDTAAQIQHSAAGAGLGRGTGAALNIAKGTAEKSDELYKTAMNEYASDRDFAYKQFADAIQNQRQNLESIRKAHEFKIGLQGNLASDYYNTLDSRISDRLKAQQDQMAAKQAYATSIAGLY